MPYWQQKASTLGVDLARTGTIFIPEVQAGNLNPLLLSLLHVRNVTLLIAHQNCWKCSLDLGTSSLQGLPASSIVRHHIHSTRGSMDG